MKLLLINVALNTKNLINQLIRQTNNLAESRYVIIKPKQCQRIGIEFTI